MNDASNPAPRPAEPGAEEPALRDTEGHAASSPGLSTLADDVAHPFDQTNGIVDGLEGDADDPEKLGERIDDVGVGFLPPADARDEELSEPDRP